MLRKENKNNGRKSFYTRPYRIEPEHNQKYSRLATNKYTKYEKPITT